MQTIWKRIHAWLDENAPPGYGALRPGASREEIRAVEMATTLVLPEDVVDSYRIHNGQSQEPGLIGGEGWSLMTLDETVSRWRYWYKNVRSFHGYLPIGYGSGGHFVFLDLNPESNAAGSVLIQRSDMDGLYLLAPSFREWLEDFANLLEADELAYSEADGCLMYADEIDID